MTTQESSSPCPRCGAPIPEDAPGGQCPKCLLREVAAPTDPAAPDPREWPALDEVRAAFPGLQVDGEIGRGGMAVVFKARQSHLDRPVALKILAPSLAGEPGFAERFSREARLLARLNHPNIVTIHDYGQAGRFFFLLMEFVDGVNLRQAMRAGRFSPEQALGLVPKICDALQYAHGEGVLHRDIKPDNILLDTKGRVKIADFGIAKLAGEAELPSMLTRSGMSLGTPVYMAPEQVERPGEVDHRADIYSLGVVLYEMLTGELPLGRFALPSEKSAVDKRIDEIVLRTLEKERERRYQSAEDVKTGVESLGGAPPPGGASVAPPADGSPDSKRAYVAALCTAASLLLALVVIGASLIVVTVETGPPEPIGAAQRGLQALLLLVTFLVMPGLGIAGTSQGAVALREIRGSRGMTGGAVFATFAALAWPLILLTGTIITLSWWLGGSIFGFKFSPTLGGWLFAATRLAGAACALWLDWRVIHKTLAWVRGADISRP